jgi:hypothetical protein
MSRCVVPATLVAVALALAAPAGAQDPPAITIRDQTDGVNSQRVVRVAAFCRGPLACTGTAKLTLRGKLLGKARFTAQRDTTFKTPIKLSASVFRALHKARGKRMRPTLTLTAADGTSIRHVITIKL